MFEFKAWLAKKQIECPNCGKLLQVGDTMYKDEYRGETLCGYCKEDYKDDVIAEEGEDGRLLR